MKRKKNKTRFGKAKHTPRNFTYAGKALREGSITEAEVERFRQPLKNFHPKPTQSRFAPKRVWQTLNEYQWQRVEEWVYVSVNGFVLYDNRLERLVDQVTIEAMMRLAEDSLSWGFDGGMEIDWEEVRDSYRCELGRTSR
jgi:hypothetical protein